MGAIQNWRTLAGVVVLTPTDLGFSFCTSDAEIGKLCNDLESGVPMATAVGFSGSACSLKGLIRVESKKGSPTISVVARDFLGKAKEDFTFRTQSDREAFFQTLLPLLGPKWHCRDTTKDYRALIGATLGGAALAILAIIWSGISLLSTANPPQNHIPAGVTWMVIGFLIIVTAACLAAHFWARKAATMPWETICLRD